MKRSEEREILMQMLCQMGIQKDFSEEAKTRFFNSFYEKRKKTKYLDAVYMLTAEHIEAIDKIICENTENWKFDRISKVDLAILRLATTEIFYVEDTPNSVAINEAVELGKKFGTEDSGKFVNGVLGKIVR